MLLRSPETNDTSPLSLFYCNTKRRIKKVAAHRKHRTESRCDKGKDTRTPKPPFESHSASVKNARRQKAPSSRELSAKLTEGVGKRLLSAQRLQLIGHVSCSLPPSFAAQMPSRSCCAGYATGVPRPSKREAFLLLPRQCIYIQKSCLADTMLCQDSFLLYSFQRTSSSDFATSCRIGFHSTFLNSAASAIGK